MSKTISDQEVFWLARYAHNTLAPLFTEAKAIEPSTKFSIELAFHNPDVEHAEGYVSIFGHWDRAAMFLYSTRHNSKADIDALAVQIRADIEKLKVTS